MKTSSLITACICFFITQFAFSQIQQDVVPYSQITTLTTSIKNLPVERLPSFDLAALQAEDEETDRYKDIPWRFGVVLDFPLNMQESGVWEQLPGGTKIWRTRIYSEGAFTLNFNFSKFKLPPGASFHIYTSDYTQYIGAFTEANHKPTYRFATTIVRSDEVIFEYNEPAQAAFNGEIVLESVVHGYRSIDKRAEGFGNSGFCNIGINCPEGAGWQDQKRAVVMILASNGNNRICTGTLVNNVREDGTPYVLSANHCKLDTNNIFVFNYESATCFPLVDGITNESVAGCRLLADNSSLTASDFQLVRLDDSPPPSFNPYYAGWSNINQPSNYSVSIHHPRGDVKKIALDHQAVKNSGYYGPGDDHWEVLAWDTGTTENASSGAPLFNEQHRVVGQLHGGDAKCLNAVSDYYGKFSYSWDTDSDTAHQLKYWLDPDDSGVNVVDGYDPNATALPNDAQMAGIAGIVPVVCSDSIHPVLRVRNKGNTTLTSFKVYFRLDHQNDSVQWNGSLAPNAITLLTLPGIAVTTGNHEFVAVCAAPNNGSDANPQNDLLSMRFFAVDAPSEVELRLTTDDYGGETSWELRNAAGTVVASSKNYPSITGGATYTEPFCLYDGCFTFTIFDAFGDGFCCATGNGNYLLRNLPVGDTIDFNQTFSSNEHSVSFCVGDSCTILVDARVNPVSETGMSDGSVYVDVIAGNPPFEYSWSHGPTSDSATGLAVGTYILTVTDTLGCIEQFTYQIDVSTGIASNDNTAQTVTLYPNPSSGVVYLEGLEDNSGTVMLYSLLGKKLAELPLVQEGGNLQSIDLTNRPAGIYLLEVVQSGKRFVKKVVRY